MGCGAEDYFNLHHHCCWAAGCIGGGGAIQNVINLIFSMGRNSRQEILFHMQTRGTPHTFCQGGKGETKG